MDWQDLGPIHYLLEEIAMHLKPRTTLRDEFAMAAMQGELAAQGEGVEQWLPPFGSLAKNCYEIADAMLAEREKGEGGIETLKSYYKEATQQATDLGWRCDALRERAEKAEDQLTHLHAKLMAERVESMRLRLIMLNRDNPTTPPSNEEKS